MDERTIFVAYQYAGSACINNTITGGAPLVAICPVALGPCIVIMFVCKLIGSEHRPSDPACKARQGIRR